MTGYMIKLTGFMSVSVYFDDDLIGSINDTAADGTKRWFASNTPTGGAPLWTVEREYKTATKEEDFGSMVGHVIAHHMKGAHGSETDATSTIKKG